MFMKKTAMWDSCVLPWLLACCGLTWVPGPPGASVSFFTHRARTLEWDDLCHLGGTTVSEDGAKGCQKAKVIPPKSPASSNNPWEHLWGQLNL